MPTVFFGLFKKVLAVTTIELVAQLSSGVTYFKYLILGANSTEIEGINSVSTKSKNWKSVNWTHPDGRVVTTVYWYGAKTGTPLIEEPLAFIKAYPTSAQDPGKVFILVNGRYVGQLSERTYSPAHIKEIDGTEYLVSYWNQGTQIRRYKTILDMNIDMLLVVPMSDSTTIWHTDTSGAQALTSQRIINPFGDYSDSNYTNTSWEFFEDINYMQMHERRLVTNADGSKTIFAITKKFNDRWERHGILEISDDGVNFSVTEIDEFTNIYDADEGADSAYEAESGVQTTWADSQVDLANCDANGSIKLIHTGTKDGTKTGTGGVNSKGKKSTYFLGCAYNRKTNLPVILQLKHGDKQHNYDLNINSVMSGDIEWYHNDNPTLNTIKQTSTITISSNGVKGSNQLFELILSDTDGTNATTIIETGDSNTTATGSVNSRDLFSSGYGGYSAGIEDFDYDFTLNYSAIRDFNIISLSNLSFVYAKNEIINGTDNIDFIDWPITNYEVIHAWGSKSVWNSNEKLYIMVDGVETLLSESASTIEDVIILTYGFEFNPSSVEVYDPDNPYLQTCNQNFYQEHTRTHTYA